MLSVSFSEWLDLLVSYASQKVCKKNWKFEISNFERIFRINVEHFGTRIDNHFHPCQHYLQCIFHPQRISIPLWKVNRRPHWRWSPWTCRTIEYQPYYMGHNMALKEKNQSNIKGLQSNACQLYHWIIMKIKKIWIFRLLQTLVPSYTRAKLYS